MDRRTLLCAIAGLPLYEWRFASASTTLSFGKKEITSVSDGHLVLPGSMLFAGMPQDELASILVTYEIPNDQVQRPCNLTLLRDEDRTILFDAGSGSGFMPSVGDIVDNLEVLGITPEDVTHVVFTHAHPDHLWGILDDFDDLIFADAEHMISQVEWDYWMDTDTVNTIGEQRASFAVGAARRLSAIEDQVTFFKDGEEVLPGVMAHETPGHTPGHTSFEIRDGSNALMVGGDAIGDHFVAFERPQWANGMDQDPELGASTRARLLDRLVTDDIGLLGFHLPEGGLGRVERNGGSYRFITEGK